MKVARQFERRGPLWVPRYQPVFPQPVPSYGPKPPGGGPRRQPPLERFERWRRRFRCAWTHYSGAGNYGTSSVGSFTLTLGFTPPAGSLLVALAAGYYTSSGTYTISISDNSSGPADSWSSITSAGSWASGNHSPFQAFACNVTSGTAPTTVTATYSSNTNYPVLVVDCYTGGPNPFVQDGSGVTAYGDSTSPSASLTTGSAANDLLWSGMTTYGSATTVSVGSPFTLETQGGGNRYNSADDGITNSTAASTQYTASWTLSSSLYWCEVLVGFKAACAAEDDSWLVSRPQGGDSPVTVWE